MTSARSRPGETSDRAHDDPSQSGGGVHRRSGGRRDVTAFGAPDPASVAATVVVVTHELAVDELERTLTALDAQTANRYEVVLVDNGRGLEPTRFSAYESLREIVRLERNRGPNPARHVGTERAAGDVVIFLDDDALPADDFVAAHRRAHAEHDIVAARGKVLPRTDTVFNRVGTHGDLGDRPGPYPINTEGNCSFDRATFLSYGGFPADVWGHEGLALSHRIRQHEPRERLLYYPDAVVYHDFATSYASLARTKARHKRARAQLRSAYPGLFAAQRRAHARLTGGRSVTDVSPTVRLVDALAEVGAAALVRLTTG